MDSCPESGIPAVRPVTRHELDYAVGRKIWSAKVFKQGNGAIKIHWSQALNVFVERGTNRFHYLISVIFERVNIKSASLGEKSWASLPALTVPSNAFEYIATNSGSTKSIAESVEQNKVELVRSGETVCFKQSVPGGFRLREMRPVIGRSVKIYRRPTLQVVDRWCPVRLV